MFTKIDGDCLMMFTSCLSHAWKSRKIRPTEGQLELEDLKKMPSNFNDNNQPSKQATNQPTNQQQENKLPTPNPPTKSPIHTPHATSFVVVAKAEAIAAEVAVVGSAATAGGRRTSGACSEDHPSQ